MVLDWNKYVETARQVSAEGCVLLKNEAHTLPLQEGCRVAVFGRIQTITIKVERVPAEW